MTSLELLDAVAASIEAVSTSPLSGYECYIGPQAGKLPARNVVLYDGGGTEAGRGISAGVGTFDENITIVMEARMPYSDTDTSRDEAYNVLKQLKAIVTANRRISAGGDLSRYATYRYEPPAIDAPAGASESTVSRQERVVQVFGTWTVPGE